MVAKVLFLSLRFNFWDEVMMRQTLLKVSLMVLGTFFSVQLAIAAEKAPAKATATKATQTTKSVAKTATKQKATEKVAKKTDSKVASKTTPKVAANQGTNETDQQLEKEGYFTTVYQCDLGDKITIYKKTDDTNNVKMRWKGKVYLLSRVQTSTGANRFENKAEGFVLVSIPSKLMLFDSIKGRQLANECRNPEQAKALYNKTHTKK